MNARTLLRRRRRRLYVGASLSLALVVGVTSWMSLGSRGSGFMITGYPTGYLPAGSTVAYQTASHSVKSNRVSADTTTSSTPAIGSYPMSPSSVPEPTSLLLMAPALLLLRRRRV